MFFVLFGFLAPINAQKLVYEKTYEVSKKAKNGFLNSVTSNDADKTTTLSFVTKTSSSKVKYENYTFDKDYNFVKVEDKEDVYVNVKYKGEKYLVEGISLEMGLTGSLIIKKKRIEYGWSWLALGYIKKTTILDKVKPKDEDGNRYLLVKNYENDETGEIIALLQPRGTTTGEYAMVKINKDLKFEVVEKITFKTFKSFHAAYTIPVENQDGKGSDDKDDKDITKSDICFVFGAGDDYEMVRVSNLGKIINRVEFKVKNGDWNILEVISKAGSLYFVGPANDVKTGGVTVTWGNNSNAKWKFYQVAKITGDKADYVTSTNMDDFEAKLKKPASQKKSPAYKGKKFTIRGATVTKDGSLFVFGQNNNGDKWEDILLFYFDNIGVLKAQYGVRLEERNKFSEHNMARQFITITDSYAYWEIWELKSINSALRAFRYPNIAKINLASGDISDFQKFGTEKEKPTYFLQSSFPYIVNPDDHSYIYLGVSKKGNKLWFGKVGIE